MNKSTSTKQTITIIVGIGTGLLLTSLWGLLFGSIWATSQSEVAPLYFWAILGGLIGAFVGGLIGSEREWIVKDQFMRIIAGVIFCGVLGLLLGFFLGARSANREFWLFLGGFFGISIGGVIGYWGKRIINRFINVIANAMFLGSIGGFIGLYWGWSAVPDYKDVGAIMGGAFGVVLGIIVGIIFGSICTTQSEWIPRRYRRIINGIIIGVGSGIIVSLVFRAISDSIAFSLMGYSWLTGLIFGSARGWIIGILPGGITGILTVSIIELIDNWFVSQQTS